MLTKALADKRLVFTSSPDQISGGGPVIVTIGTPVDEFLNPVRQRRAGLHRRAAAASRRRPAAGAALDRLSRHHRLARIPISQAKGRKLKVAFCPERVVQGYGIKELREMPQIVSGTTPEAERKRRRCSSASRRKSWWSSRSRPNSPSCSATPTATSNSPPPTSST